jgi:hypothetical protein
VVGSTTVISVLGFGHGGRIQAVEYGNQAKTGPLVLHVCADGAMRTNEFIAVFYVGLGGVGLSSFDFMSKIFWPAAQVPIGPVDSNEE